MNQAEATKLVSRLRIPYGAKHRRLRNPEGPLGRVKSIRALVTALFKYERIEVMHYPGDEARGEFYCSIVCQASKFDYHFIISWLKYFFLK